jgi:hypothetical protein
MSFMASQRQKPSRERPPDLEIGAAVRANRLRFGKRPHARVEFRGDSLVESHSGSERENLPDEVEPDVTYRNVRVGWRAAAWAENAAKEPAQSLKTDEEQES